MKDASFFTHPVLDWQRRYEALRASFVDRLPAHLVAQRFHYSPQYVRLLRHLFTSEKLDFSEPVPEALSNRHRVDSPTREKIKTYRSHSLSAGDIETVKEVLKEYEEFIAGVILRHLFFDFRVFPVYFSRENPKGTRMEVELEF